MDAKSGRMNAGQKPGKVARSTQFANWRMNYRAWAFAATLAAVGLTGCQNSQNIFASKNATPARLPPRSVPYLTGVAVPSGFDMSERLTDAYESGGVRFARQEYVGSADPYAVRDFYKEQMPLLGWREISSHDIKGKLFLRFENNREECNVTIEPSIWFNRATIQIVVKPFNRTASEPPARRPMP